jgi:hypothetical protein
MLVARTYRLVHCVAHLVLFANLTSAKREEVDVSSSRAGDSSQDIQQPRHSAHYAQHGHVRVNTLDSRMLDATVQVVEVLSEPDFAHNVKAEEHRPCRDIHGFSSILGNLGIEQIRLCLDTRFIRAKC